MIVVSRPLLKYNGYEVWPSNYSRSDDRIYDIYTEPATSSFVSKYCYIFPRRKRREKTVLVTLISHLHGHTHIHHTPTIQNHNNIQLTELYRDSSCVRFIPHLSPSNSTRSEYSNFFFPSKLNYKMVINYKWNFFAYNVTEQWINECSTWNRHFI